MCSVVEIKNSSEYCITYHSPESLEALSSPSQSLEYQHLFKVSSKSNDDSLYGSQSQTSPISPDSEPGDEKNVISSDDKDFSLEEITRHQSRDTGDLETTRPGEEVGDDDDNLDNPTNNEQNGGKVERVQKGMDRELKGLSQSMLNLPHWT